MQNINIYLKLFDGSSYGECKTFYFFEPALPSRIPRFGDAAKPGDGAVFVPSGNDLQAAREFAEQGWGYTILREGNLLVFRKIDTATQDK